MKSKKAGQAKKSSKYYGVSFCRKTGRWKAVLNKGGYVYLGMHGTEEQAATAVKEYLATKERPARKIIPIPTAPQIPAELPKPTRSLAVRNRKTRREITDIDRAFYRLGQLDAEEYIQKTMMILRQSIEQLKRVNALLVDEIYNLDESRPRAGVLVSLKVVWRVVKALKKLSVNLPLAEILEEMYEQAKLGEKPEFDEDEVE